jgi:hypothetical protein
MSFFVQVLNKKDRSESFQLFEPKKVKVNNKRAFLLCTHDGILNGKPVRIENSADQYKSSPNLNKSDKYSNNNNKKQSKIDTKASSGKIIKEFSFFDWSKVKLKGEEYLRNEKEDAFKNSKYLSDDEIEKMRAEAFKKLPQVIALRFD